MNPVPLPWMILGFALAFASGYGAGVWREKGAEQARETKEALTASQTETQRATKTTDILGTLLARPDFASDSVIAAGLCQQPADSAGLPKTADSPRPPRPASAGNEQPNQRLAAEMKQCVRLADEWNALRAIWHANEAKP